MFLFCSRYHLFCAPYYFLGANTPFSSPVAIQKPFIISVSSLLYHFRPGLKRITTGVTISHELKRVEKIP